MNNEEKKRVKTIQDLTLAIAKVMGFVEPKDEIEHFSIIVTGVVTYINEWLNFNGINGKDRKEYIKTFAGAVVKASDIVVGDDNISSDDVN